MKFPLKSITLSSGEKITLESAQLSDAESLWNFGRTVAMEDEFQAMTPDEFKVKPEDEPKFIKDNEDHPCKLALIARSEQGEVVAMCHLKPVTHLKKMGHVVDTSIGILASYRDKKLGQILMSEMIQMAKTNPAIEKIELRVLSSNDRAIALYKKLNFTEAGRLKNEFKFGPNDYRDDVLMELMIR